MSNLVEVVDTEQMGPSPTTGVKRRRFVISQQPIGTAGRASEQKNNSNLATLWVGWACLPSSYQAKSQQYCGPNGPTASIFYGIWIKQSDAMVFIFNLDKVSPKKLFPTMNI